MREFEQMEMQFFIKPGEQKKWYEFWKETRMKWHLSLGIDQDKYRFHNHEKLAHYADAACDIEFEFPFGFKELEEFIQELILIYQIMKSFLPNKLNILIHLIKKIYTIRY